MKCALGTTALSAETEIDMVEVWQCSSTIHSHIVACMVKGTEVLEVIFVELSCSSGTSRKVCLGVFYRPPSSSVIL